MMIETEFRWWSPWREADGATILHVDLAEHADHEALAFAMLDDEEAARCHRFLAPGARRRFVLCRAALRVILSERLDCPNHQLSFGYGEHGKPFARVAHKRASIGFNASHSGCHGLIAVADQGGVGVDVEERVPRYDLEGIGSLVYGPKEQRLLARTAESGKLHLFYRLWSMKEALIKALGSGFSLNPSGFEVPEPMLHGDRSSVFQFPHAPSRSWHLTDLSEERFAAAFAHRI